MSNQTNANSQDAYWLSSRGVDAISFNKLSAPPLAFLDKGILYELNDGVLYYNGAGIAPVAIGDVTGPAVSTDNALPRWDGIGGDVIQNSVVTVSDVGAMAGVASLNGSAIPATIGDVIGPGAATDDALARYDGVTGKLVQNSVVTVSDVGAMAGVASINGAAIPAGFGDVVGPGAATDNAIVRYDGATGKLVQNSLVTVSDGGVVTSAGYSGSGATTFVNGTSISLNASGTVFLPAAISLLSDFFRNVTPGTDTTITGNGSGVRLNPDPAKDVYVSAGTGLRVNSISPYSGATLTLNGPTTIDLVTAAGSVRCSAGQAFLADTVSPRSAGSLTVSAPSGSVLLLPNAANAVEVTTGQGIYATDLKGPAGALTALVNGVNPLTTSTTLANNVNQDVRTTASPSWVSPRATTGMLYGSASRVVLQEAIYFAYNAASVFYSYSAPTNGDVLVVEVHVAVRDSVTPGFGEYRRSYMCSSNGAALTVATGASNVTAENGAGFNNTITAAGSGTSLQFTVTPAGAGAANNKTMTGLAKVYRL